MNNPKLLGAAIAAVALLASPVLAADLIIDEPEAAVFAAEDVADLYDWTGPYIGLNAGVAFGVPHAEGDDEWPWPAGVLEYEPEYPSPEPFGDDDDFLPFAGIQAGFNYQLDNSLVVGIEGDLQGSAHAFGDDDDDAPMEVDALLLPPSSFDFTPDVDFWGTLRARVGVAFDRTLLYATGGLAFGQTSMGGAWWLPDDFDADDTRFGYAIGAGIEHAVTDEISLKGEYLFVNLGEVGDTMPFDSPGFDSDLAFHTVRAGINFHF